MEYISTIFNIKILIHLDSCAYPNTSSPYYKNYPFQAFFTEFVYIKEPLCLINSQVSLRIREFFNNHNPIRKATPILLHPSNEPPS